MELVEFLRARLDEDWAVVAGLDDDPTDPEPWRLTVSDGSYYCHPSAHLSKARVLAEVEAKRRIVDLHSRAHHQCVAEDGPTQWHANDPCATLRLLALPYVAHPDYDEAWRP